MEQQTNLLFVKFFEKIKYVLKAGNEIDVSRSRYLVSGLF
jgi:hypothetical protein